MVNDLANENMFLDFTQGLIPEENIIKLNIAIVRVRLILVTREGSLHPAGELILVSNIHIFL